jgi:hypothetical protein
MSQFVFWIPREYAFSIFHNKRDVAPSVSDDSLTGRQNSYSRREACQALNKYQAFVLGYL